MLTIWRRHVPTCPHRSKGRDHLKCHCPLWADGYVDGKRALRVSLNTRDMARARKRAVALESDEAIAVKPLEDAVAAYLLNCQHLAAVTQRKYRNRLQKQLLPFCQARSIDYVSEVSVEVLDDFRATRELALTTSARELDTLRQFFTFCLKRYWIADNPAKEIDPPRNAKPQPVVPYTEQEVAGMIEAAGQIGKGDYERLRARAAVLLLRHTGLRISDVAMLERDRVQKGSLLLHTRKTGATISLPLPDEVTAALAAVPTPKGADPKKSKYFFANGMSASRTPITHMEGCLRAVFRKSGVAHAHAHRFRHTLATEILANGGTLTDVADILGISETIARKHYAKWNQARQDRISALMRVMQAGKSQRKKLVVIA
jgi:site-specific recombinase XerD